MKTTTQGPATAMRRPRKSEKTPETPGQVVLVFQGGGALGAFQAGVYEALADAGVAPDWLIGTSIGAINASLIAGNTPEDRVPRLRAFWERMAHVTDWWSEADRPQALQTLAFWSTMLRGVPGFFTPHPPAFWGPHVRLGSEKAGYYSTSPLAKTLQELVDFDLLNTEGPRLTVGAARVRTSEMTYFDSRDQALDVRHVLASGALPPAFPPVRIDGELYWDGGILSNTPSEVVFDDYPRRSSLIFAVHMWRPEGDEPETMWEVLNRQKDIQYSSRVAGHIKRQLEAHRLRHVISELAARLPEDIRSTPEAADLAAWGCKTRMHVVRLLAPRLGMEDHTKDVDFSPSGIRRRWDAGRDAAARALAARPWENAFDPLEGVILHEV